MELEPKSVRVAFVFASCGAMYVDENANAIFLRHNVARELGDREGEESRMTRAIAVCVVKTDNSYTPAEPFLYSHTSGYISRLPWELRVSRGVPVAYRRKFASH